MWTELRPLGNTSQTWRAFSGSASCKYLIAGVVGGGVYVSSDYGETWTNTGLPNRNYYDACVNYNGSVMIVTAEDASPATNVFISTDYGVNWTSLRLGIAMIGCTVNSTGDIMYLGDGLDTTNTVLKSTDYGANWSTVRGGTDNYAYHIHSRGTGDIVIAGGDFNFGIIYGSTNGGSSWTNLLVRVYPYSRHAYFSASDYSGTVITASVYDEDINRGKLRISTDSGTTWSVYDNTTNANEFSGQAINNNGQRLIIARQSPLVWYSYDYASTWTEVNPSENTDSISYTYMSYSGLMMYAIGGRIWVNQIVKETNGAAFLLNIINKKARVC